MKILVKTLCVTVLNISLVNATEGVVFNYDINTTDMTKFGGTGFSIAQDYMKLNLNQDASGCEKYNLNPTDGLTGLASSIKKSTQFYSCPEARLNIGSRFSKEACQNALVCRQSIGSSGANLQQADIILNEIIAKDYVKNAIIINGDDMERVETLREFAQKKYDKKLGSQCLGRFQRKGVSDCKMSIVEAAFEERQTECTFGNGCYSSDNLELDIDSYKKFKSKNKDKDGKFISEYFKYRIATTTQKYLVDDEKRIEDLSALVTSDIFKSAKTEQKIESFLKLVGKDTSGRIKDPILSFDLGSDFAPASLKKSEKFKELLKVLESKNMTKESFAKDFESYRKKRVEAILGNNEICKKTESLIKICSDATKIVKGKSITRDSLSAEHLSSRDTKTASGVELLKRFLGTSFNEDDFEALVNARRCISYGFTDEFGNVYDRGLSITGGPGFRDRSGSDAAEDNGMVSREESVNPSTEGMQRSEKSVVEATGIGSSKIETSAEPKGEDAISVEDSASKLEGYQNGIGQTPPAQISSNFSDMFNNNFDTFAGKAKEKVETDGDKVEEVATTSGPASSQDKMNEYLMKKLASAEENLEKFKADSDAAEADRAKQKKVEEETALIKDLKGQIADLKVQTAKNATKVADTAAEQGRVMAASNSHNNSFSSGASITSSRSEAPAVKSVSENFESAHSSAAAPATAARASSASGAILSTISNNDGSRTTTLASGMVLTTVDGMTSEKATQTISNRILELNGTPFYIEEGGMVKEIIAVVKDGKVLLDENGNPIFEKIVKGKVGDKKFAAKMKDKKDRAPASITDVADLKRDQEEKMKRERAEYLKLKNLTNGALRKK